MAKIRKLNGRQETRVKVAHANCEAERGNYSALKRRHEKHTHYPQPEANAVFNGLEAAVYEADKTAKYTLEALARLAEMRAQGLDANEALDAELIKLDMLEDDNA